MDVARYDGLLNCLTGLGDTSADTLDTRQRTIRTVGHPKTTLELEQEWLQSWMAYREVSLMAEALFREGFDLVGLSEEFDTKKIKSYIEGDYRIRPDGSIDRSKGIPWYAWQLREKGDLFGGAALFAILDDGLDPVEPLDVRRITRVAGWEVFDRDEITPVPGFMSRNLEPEYWMLSGLGLSASMPAGAGRELRPGDVIHESRLKFNLGREPSRRERRNRNYWGVSVLELNARERRGAEEGNEYARTYLDRASWLHFQMAELQEVLNAKDKDGNKIGDDIVRARLRAFRQGLRTMGVGITDGGRESEKIPGSANGEERRGRPADKLASVGESSGDLSKLVQMNYDGWAYGTSYPRSIAFGETPTGLHGGDNAGDWQKFEGDVRSQFNTWGKPVLNWMLVISFAAKEGPTAGKIPDDWTLQPRPLRVPTAKEKAEIAEKQALADKVRIDSHVVTSEEVRQQRIINGDVDSPLAVDPGLVVEDDETGVGPAQVGVAQAVLQAGMAVAAGEATPEFMALYLTSIDDPRYPTEKAQAMAEAAKPKVPALGLPGAPAPAVPGPSSPATPGSSPTLAGPPTDPASIPGPMVATEDAAPALPPPDPWAVLAEIPDDLMTPEAIVAEIQRRTPMLTINTRHIHALARKHRIQRVPIAGGVSGYSAGKIADAIAGGRGQLPEPAPADDEPEAIE